MKPDILELEKLKTVLDYAPNDGNFYWKVSIKGRWREKGDIAGSWRDGYRIISYDNRNYRGGPLAWYFMTGNWPTKRIRYRDGNRSNIRWINLCLERVEKPVVRRPPGRPRGSNTSSSNYYSMFDFPAYHY